MSSIDYFDRGHDLNPARAALIDVATGESYSFADVKARTEQIAAALTRHGFANQAQLAIFAPNSAIAMILLLACWRANAQWIPVNTRNAVDANAQYLAYVECEWIIYDRSLEAQVDEMRAACPKLTNLVCIDDLDSFIGDTTPADFIPPEVDAFGNLDELVGIIPTGGTTGPSKGAMVTNLGWGTMIETAAQEMGGRTNDPVSLVVAPITHAAGPVALATMSFGATQVILPGFDADTVLSCIEQYRVSHMYLPPTALYSLLGSPQLGLHDMSSLRIFILVGSPVSPEKLRIAVDTFGACMCQCYGQVECPMVISWLSPETVAEAATGYKPERLASCGKPTRSIQVALLDDDGAEVAMGEAGEICVRGPLVSKGYFKKPEATEEVRAYGWHHTGDIARADADGFLYIVDRKKDMVVSGGFNVFTAEVEAVITQLSQLRECAVIGVPHEKWGEAVHAIVVGDGLDEAQIIAHAKAQLGSVKAPKSVEFVSEIPRTAAGKPDKKALRIAHWGENARMVN
ncbi:AMP-binding protein [Altericroceibacterium endophyticum]|uniref:AMP-binding protein n=1 Tax=Altericroceibacterium endophyticum TaxID=1808508 RepID=A0A6I4T0Y8_9SPHN|nr:AMP-binding protein [Altericroceibacterium endophyticum]MXO64814.1 AMP-binding protein [Altericroceibacterium endophyticum]